MSYNLDENLEESFQFRLGGNDYTFRYPNTEEAAAGDKLTPEAQLEWLYGYIEAVNDSAPAIKDALNKANVKVIQRFNSMIREEFRSEA